VCAFLLFASSAFAAPFTSAQSGNWNNTLTWGGAGVPGTGDTVTITSNHVVTVTDPRVALTVTLDNTPGNKMLVIDSAGTLLVESAAGPAVAINAPSPGSTNIVRMNGGQLETSGVGVGINITGGASSASKLEFTPLGGTAKFAGHVVFAGTAANALIDFGPNGGTVEIGGDLGSGGTFVNNTSSTVEINGSGTQTINGYTFNHFVVNKAGGPATLNGPINVNGNLTVSSGVFDDGGNQISLNGGGTSSVTVGSTGVLKLGSGASATFFPTPLGSSTMNTGSAIVYQSGLQQAINSTVIYDRLYLATLGSAVSHITTGASLTVVSQLDITDNGANTVTLDLGTGTLDLNGELTGDGTVSMTSGSMTIAGNFSSVASLSAGTGTVTYDGGAAQSVLGATYHNLDINKSAGTATLNGNATVNGNLGVLSIGPLAAGTNTITLLGDATVNSTFDVSSGTLRFNGTSLQTLNLPSSSFNVENLEINNGTQINITSLGTTVEGSLTLNGGKLFVAGTFMIDVLATVTRNTGWIVGAVTMGMNPTPARTFHVGTSLSYLPVDVDSSMVGTLTLEAVEGQHPNRTGNNVLDRYWRIVAPFSITSVDSITFNYNPADITTGDEAKYHLAHYINPTWTQHGDVVNEVVNNATLASQSVSAKDFIVGQRGSTGAAGRIAITSVNGGSNPSVNVPFDVDVETQHDNGVAANVTASSSVDVLLDTGTGGLLSGNAPIGAGTSTGTATVSYDTVESNVRLVGVSASGDLLDDGLSPFFDVISAPASLTVSNTNDAGPGSLRDAITAANTGGCAASCTIDFSTSGMIILNSALPAITRDDLLIDGFTATSATANTNAFGAPSNANITIGIDGVNGIPIGFDIQGTVVRIRGFAIRNFFNGGTGIGVKFSGTNTGSNISGCTIGTDMAGSTAAPNAYGVLFSGSTEASLGGSLPASRNLVSGNTIYGVKTDTAANSISLVGNYIGTNAALTSAIANNTGVYVCSGCSVTIGSAGLGNVVSGNTATGIVLAGGGADLKGNIIGPAGSSALALPNATGIQNDAGSNFNTIGGSVAGEGNTIAGNTQNGILVRGDDNTIQGNLVGIASDGLTPMGNAGSGIRLENSAARNTVNSNNKIAHNVNDGVTIATNGTGIGNVVRQNKVAGNTNRGIDIDDDGTTNNDATDADLGANNRQNFPVINEAKYSAGIVTVKVTMDSSGGVATNFFAFDVYKADGSPAPQALEYLGTSGCVAGNVFTNFTFGVTAGTAVVGNNVVASATAYSDAACNTPSEGTSELSAATRIGGPVHWIAGTGNWETAANWNPAVVPTSSDDAFIDNPGTYTVTINTLVNVGSVQVGIAGGTQTLNIPASQSINLNNASTVTANGALTLSGIGLNAIGTLTINGVFDWNVGSIGGAGGVTINSGGTLNIKTASGKTLLGANLTIANGATANWLGGPINVSSGANIDNFGTFEIQTDATIADSGGAGTFDNNGTFRKTITSGPTNFTNFTFNHNAGTVDIQTGRLNLAGGTATAPFVIASAADVFIDDNIYIFANGAGSGGLGKIHISGGTLNVTGAAVTIPHLLIDAGTLGGSGTSTTGASGSWVWSGGTLGGTGASIIATGSSFSIGTATAKSLVNRTLTIQSGVFAGWFNTGAIQISSGGTINNAGTFDAQGDASMTDAGSDGGFVNSGTFRKSASAGTTGIVNVDFTNTGTIDVVTGTLNPSNVTSSGNITLAGTLLVDDNVVTLNGASNVSGAGLLHVNGGTLTVDAPDLLPNVQLDLGTINGNATFDITSFAWNGGTMSGTGTTNIPAGATATISTGNGKSLQRTFSIANTGAVNVGGTGTINFGSGGNIANDGTFQVLLPMTFNDAGSGGDFNNTRTFRANAGGTVTFSNITLNSSTAAGLIEVQTNTLDLADGTNNAAINISGGATLLVNSDTYTFGTGTTLSGGGTVNLNLGTLNVTAPVSIPQFTQSGGTLDGTGTVTFTNIATWDNGIWQGGGTTTVGATGTLTFATPSAKTLNNRTLSSVAGATINLPGNGPINLSNGGNIANAGLFLITANNTFNDGGTGGNFVNTGTLRKQTATGPTSLTGIGLTNNGGLIDIQSGTVDLAGDVFTQAAGSTLKVWLNGTTPGTGFGRLSSNNSVNLAGTLEVALVGLYQPVGGDTFRVVAAPAHVGDFTQPYTYPLLAAGRTFSDAYDGSGLLLTVNGDADLSIGKSAPSNVLVGAPISYTLTVNNAGPDIANSVSVTDTLEPGHGSVNASGSGWVCNAIGLTVTCTVASLPTGAAPAITINANAPVTPTSFTNTANVSSANDSNGANNSGTAFVTVDPNQAEVELTKNGPPLPVPPSTPFTFDFIIANNGPQTATNVSFSAPIPSTLTYNSATPDAGTCNFSAGTVTCNVGNILNGSNLTVVIGLTTTSTAGTHTVTGTATALETDPIPGNNSVTAAVEVTGSTITVVNTNDSGMGSLRQALLDSASGVCTPLPCTIDFNIPSGPFLIQPTVELPIVDEQTLIDATTQPGYSGTPIIQIDGQSFFVYALQIDGDNSAVKGLSMTGFSWGVDIHGDNNTLEANYLGLDPSGTIAANGDGVRISGNNNVIGGTTPAQRNFISGNTNAGVYVEGDVTGNSISGNYIGTDPAGTSARPNTIGVMVVGDADATVIGGPTAAHRNVISGNTDYGVYVEGSGGAVVAGTIGSNAPTDGIIDGTIIRSNLIGPDVSGTSTLGAGIAGISVFDNAKGTGIALNDIAGNQNGIVLVGASEATNIDANSIHDNTLLGIDLEADGVTPNDSNDSDSGPDGLQNFPTLTTVVLIGGGDISISSNIDSSGASPTIGSIRVDYFEADSSGEGEFHLGFACVAGNSFGLTTSFNQPTVSVGDPIVATATSFTDAACTTVADGTSEFSNVVIAANCTPPPVTITGPTQMCATGSVTLDAGPGFSGYSWSTGALTQTINVSPASTTTYTVTVTDNLGCTNVDSHTVTVNPLPIVTITGPTTMCAGGNVVLDAGPGFSGYSWSTGALTQTITVSPASTQTYNVTVTDANTCQATDSHTVTVTATPSVTITGPTSTCAGTPVTLDAGPGFASYSWSTGEFTQMITVSPATTQNYSVTVSDGTCNATDSHNVVVTTPPAMSITASGPTTFCAGGSVVLTANGGTSWAWSNGATTQSITVNTSGTFSVVGTSGGCSASSAPTTVTVNPAPVVTITGPTSTCVGAPITLDAGAGFASYSWNNGANTQTITVSPTSTTNYIVTVTDGSSCSASDSHTVTVSANPTATINAPAGVCENSTGNSANVAAQAGATYDWTIGNGTITAGLGTNAITFTAGSSGTVTLGVVVTAASCTSTGNVNVPITTPPTVTITGPATACAGTSVTLDPGAGFASYLWSNGSTSQTITVISNVDETHTVTVTSASGCTATDSHTVTRTGAPAATINAPSSANPNQSGLIANVPVQPGATYAWSIDNGTITSGNGTDSIVFTAGASGLTELDVVVSLGGCSTNANHFVFIETAQGSGADLAVTKSAPPTAQSGAAITYTIGVRNFGPDAASGIVITDTLPAGTTFVSMNTGPWNCTRTNATIQCTGSAAAGINSTITIIVNAPQQSGIITNTVQIASATPDPNATNNAASATTSVASTPPSCSANSPSLLLPVDAASVNSPVTFTWTAVTGAGEYELWVNDTLVAVTTSTTATHPLPSGTSSWFVVARFNNGCDPRRSITRTFTVLQSNGCAANGAPQIMTPVGGTITSPTTFAWTPVAQAIGYRLWVEANGTAAQDLGSTNGATALTVSLPAGPIVAYIEAFFSGCPPTRSAPVSLFVARPDPCASRSTAAPLSPASNSVVNSSSIEFTWSEAPGADGYRVWYSLDGAPFAVLGATTIDTSLNAAIGRGVVDWYVETLHDGCASTESQTRRFTIPARSDCTQQKPDPQAPANDATVINGNVLFAWSAVPNAVSYELWVAVDNGTHVLFGTTPNTTLTRRVPAGRIEWFVRAVVNRCLPRDSQTFQFTFAPLVACDGDERAIPVAPLDGVQVSSPVRFAWTDAGADRYEVYVVRGSNAPALVASTSQREVSGVNIAAGKVRWFVRAHFGGNCAPLDSEDRVLEIVGMPPACSELAAPVISAPSQISSDVPVLIQWTPVNGATAYQVLFAHTADFQHALIDTVTGTQLHYTVGGDIPSSAFVQYIRVRAIDARCQPATVSPYGPTHILFVLPKDGGFGSAPFGSNADVRFEVELGPQYAGQTFTAAPRYPWLSVSPANGVVGPNGTKLIVTARTADLPLGTSVGAISVTFSSAAAGGVASNDGPIGFPLSISLVTPVTPTPTNTPPPDALIIPAVAHADGINSHFQSDVRVSNTSAQLVTYQLTFTPSGGAGITQGQQSTFSIEPGRTIALDDILKSWFGGVSAIGTLEIRPLTQTTTSTQGTAFAGLANLATFASSRTFNMTSNGTFGQYIPAVPFANFIGSQRILSLQQIAQSPRYRTNLGLLEGSGEPASLLVRMFGDGGQLLGQFPVNLNGGQHMQLNAFLLERGIDNLNDGRVEVEVVSDGGKITAYASVLDNLTSDPLLVTPVPIDSEGATKWVLPGVADLASGFANWQTDMRLFNAGTEDVETTLSFYSQNGGSPKTATVTIPAGQVRQFDKALSSIFNATNDGGAVHITTANVAKLIATARTYNQTGSGTYGQFISAVTPNESAGVESRPLQLLQVEESDRFRSNIGIVEVTGKPVRLEIAVVPPDAKFTAVTEVFLNGNEFRQFGSLLKSVGLADTHNARVTVRVIDGEGRVTAYASVIDMLTNDPTYVPAQ
jgi:uncharacterized repeat protein (TIGR01451 family)